MQKKRNKRKLYQRQWPFFCENWIFNCLWSKNISEDCVTYTNISKIHKLYNEFISTVTLDTTNFNKYIHFATIWQKKRTK